MGSRLVMWFAGLVVAGCLAAQVVAQNDPAPPPAPETPAQPVPERRPPAPEYMVACLVAMAVLFVVCMPSRKG